MKRAALRANDVRKVDNTRFNTDRTRFCIPAGNGFACYRGSTDWQGEWKGQLVGVAETEAEAIRFLDGYIVSLAPVF